MQPKHKRLSCRTDRAVRCGDWAQAGTIGGANWPPRSYDPDIQLRYVCASDRINSFSVDENLDEPAANQVYMAGAVSPTAGSD